MILLRKLTIRALFTKRKPRLDEQSVILYTYFFANGCLPIGLDCIPIVRAGPFPSAPAQRCRADN